MSNIDLQKFCGVDETRPYLMRPFSFGDFTYATNGHVMVRLPRISDVKEIEKSGTWDKPLDCHAGADFRAADDFLLPALKPSEEEQCSVCDGRGYIHDCPDCECICSMCDGKGFEIAEKRTSTTLCGASCSLRYVRMILDLPGIEISGNPSANGSPIPFRFEGGIGALMPLNCRYPDHIEIDPQQVSAQGATQSPREAAAPRSG